MNPLPDPPDGSSQPASCPPDAAPQLRPGEGPAAELELAALSRALGHPAPGTYKEYVKLASIKEVGGVPSANDMIRHLVAAQEATARTARDVFSLASNANDQPTADLLTQRLEVHEKTAWMLRSLLEK